jgi:vacuolar-type H+-ATPase subunit F/Vma7
MGSIVVIGDELTCVGFALTGVSTCCPPPAELVAAFTRALDTASLLVLSRTAADALPPEVLHEARLRESPLLVVLPDLTDPQPDAALQRRMRAVLGIEA